MNLGFILMLLLAACLAAPPLCLIGYLQRRNAAAKRWFLIVMLPTAIVSFLTVLYVQTQLNTPDSGRVWGQFYLPLIFYAVHALVSLFQLRNK